MRRQLLYAALLLPAIMLGGCTTGGGGTPTTGGVPITTGNPTADTIIAAVFNGCKYVPTVDTALALIANFYPQAGVVGSMADQIASVVCSAVTKKSFRRGQKPARAYGVPIRGTQYR